jgi:hypothetical protein
MSIARFYEYVYPDISCLLRIERLIIAKLSYTKDGQVISETSDTRNSKENKPFISDKNKTPGKENVNFDCTTNSVPANFNHALGRYLNGNTYAVRVSAQTLEAIDIYRKDVHENRYAKYRKIRWITGYITPIIEGESQDFFRSIHYAVYFYPDGSEKRYFYFYHEYEKGGDVTHNVEEFENEVRKNYGDTATAVINGYGAYVRYILSASESELQKEFDLYKKNVVLVKPKGISYSPMSFPD